MAMAMAMMGMGMAMMEMAMAMAMMAMVVCFYRHRTHFNPLSSAVVWRKGKLLYHLQGHEYGVEVLALESGEVVTGTCKFGNHLCVCVFFLKTFTESKN